MLFTVTSDLKVNPLNVKYNARTFVLLCKKSVTEKLLDNYLIKNYKIPLVVACMKIINKATYNINNKGELVITVIDKKLDKLASLITFGTGKLHGSSILRYAFGQI